MSKRTPPTTPATDPETPAVDWVPDDGATAALFATDATGDSPDSTDSGDSSPVAASGAVERNLYERQDRFLAAWVSAGDERAGCLASGTSLRTVQRWKHDDVLGFRERHWSGHLTLCAEIEAKLTYMWRGLKPGQNVLALVIAANAEMPDKYRPNAVVADGTALETLRFLKEQAAKAAKAAKAPKASPDEAERTFLDTLGKP